jgi:CheY-like chemotaxis protein
VSDGGTILVVEDDHEIREAMETLLEELGYRVLTAADGRQAMQLLARIDGTSDRPRVIVLDLMMPVMNGWEVLTALQETPSLAGIPVLVISAFSDQAPKEGVRAVLRKPVPVDRLLAAIESAW